MGRSPWTKKPLIPLLLLVGLLIAAILLFSGGGDAETVPLVGGSESVLERLRTQKSQIDRVQLDGSKVRIAYTDGRTVNARLPEGLDFFVYLGDEVIAKIN